MVKQRDFVICRSYASSLTDLTTASPLFMKSAIYWSIACSSKRVKGSRQPFSSSPLERSGQWATTSQAEAPPRNKKPLEAKHERRWEGVKQTRVWWWRKGEMKCCVQRCSDGVFSSKVIICAALQVMDAFLLPRFYFTRSLHERCFYNISAEVTMTFLTARRNQVKEMTLQPHRELFIPAQGAVFFFFLITESWPWEQIGGSSKAAGKNKLKVNFIRLASMHAGRYSVYKTGSFIKLTKSTWHHKNVICQSRCQKGRKLFYFLGLPTTALWSQWLSACKSFPNFTFQEGLLKMWFVPTTHFFLGGHDGFLKSGEQETKDQISPPMWHVATQETFVCHNQEVMLWLPSPDQTPFFMFYYL